MWATRTMSLRDTAFPRWSTTRPRPEPRLGNKRMSGCGAQGQREGQTQTTRWRRIRDGNPKEEVGSGVQGTAQEDKVFFCGERMF